MYIYSEIQSVLIIHIWGSDWKKNTLSMQTSEIKPKGARGTLKEHKQGQKQMKKVQKDSREKQG